MVTSERRALISRASAGILLGLALASAIGCHRRTGHRPDPGATVSDGYTERTKAEASGTVQSVNFADRPEVKVSRVEELLENRFSGVTVRRTTDGGYSVRIGGAGSFMSNEEPLWVIDGTPFEVKSGRALSWLNPADVVRIDVLRNPSETSIYGVRGGNGVIVVTTRRP
jgi:TonB-dependent SusC/RagA subfamily outer membrane receptor